MRTELLNKRIELSNKWLGTLAAFGTMFLFWLIAEAGYELLCIPVWCAEAREIMILLISAALAGFAIGALLTPQITLWQTKWGSAMLGVVMGSLLLTSSHPPSSADLVSYAVLALFVVPSLSTISANRGARLRNEKKWTHIVWLIVVVGVLLATFAAVEAISDALDSLPVVKRYMC